MRLQSFGLELFPVCTAVGKLQGPLRPCSLLRKAKEGPLPIATLLQSLSWINIVTMTLFVHSQRVGPLQLPPVGSRTGGRPQLLAPNLTLTLSRPHFTSLRLPPANECAGFLFHATVARGLPIGLAGTLLELHCSPGLPH